MLRALWPHLRADLDEASSWGVVEPELRAALDRAREAGATARALVVINPGNPTGQSLPKEVVAMILRFAAAEGLVRSRSARSHPKRAVP